MPDPRDLNDLTRQLAGTAFNWLAEHATELYERGWDACIDVAAEKVREARDGSEAVKLLVRLGEQPVQVPADMLRRIRVDLSDYDSMTTDELIASGTGAGTADGEASKDELALQSTFPDDQWWRDDENH